MLQYIDKAISYIAPHECIACGVESAPLCQDCLPLLPDAPPQCYKCRNSSDGYTTCKKCKNSTTPDQVWICTSYEGFAEALIHQLKFERTFQAADTIATSLILRFGYALLPDMTFVPIPTATSRVRQRGYDQSVLIAQALARKTTLPCTNLLIRLGQHRQTNSTRSQRLRQLNGAFQVKKNTFENHKIIVLVDDVLTTGATTEAAVKAIRSDGFKGKIISLVFANTLS